MSGEIKNCFLELIARKEDAENRTIDRRTMERESGVSYTTAQRWLDGEIGDYRGASLVKICDWLGVPLHVLLHYEPEPADE